MRLVTAPLPAPRVQRCDHALRQLTATSPTGPVIHRLLAVLALTGVAVLTPAATSGAPPPPPPVTAPAGSIGVPRLDEPTSESDDPRARLYIIDHLDLGAVIHRRIEIVNTTAHPAQLTVYPDAAAITGGTFTAAPGHTPNERPNGSAPTPRR